MHQLFTLNSVTGDHSSSHPEGGHIAYLYHSHELADDAIKQMEAPDQWQVKEIADLPEWLEKCKLDGITHILESKSGDITNMHQLQNFVMFANSAGGKHSLEE
jgi:hypothetical protein